MGSQGKRVHPVLSPPPGIETYVMPFGDEELLVVRLPLAVPSVPKVLSTAESEVAALAVAGLSNAEIAKRRGTSTRTVANQMAAIFKKVGAGSRAELAHALVHGDGRDP